MKAFYNNRDSSSEKLTQIFGAGTNPHKLSQVLLNLASEAQKGNAVAIQVQTTFVNDIQLVKDSAEETMKKGYRVRY